MFAVGSRFNVLLLQEPLVMYSPFALQLSQGSQYTSFESDAESARITTYAKNSELDVTSSDYDFLN